MIKLRWVRVRVRVRGFDGAKNSLRNRAFIIAVIV